MTAVDQDAAPARSFDELLALVDDAGERSHSENTRKTYGWSWASWSAFCEDHGNDPGLPVDDRHLAAWAADQACKGKAPNTILTRARALRSLHVRPYLAGLDVPAEPYPQPSMVLVENVIRGHRKDLNRHGWEPKSAPAMLLADLRVIVHGMDFRRAIDLRDHAILALGFYMGARRSELECLDIANVALDDDGWLMIWLCSSKTDQDGNGTVVRIPPGGDLATCAVRAVMAWIAWLAARKVKSGPLFRCMNRYGNTLIIPAKAKHPDALAGRMSGEAICNVYTKRSIRAGVRGYLGRLKVLTGHSGRKGAATEAAANGATHEQLCDAFRWKRGSQMAARYIEATDLKANHPLARLG